MKNRAPAVLTVQYLVLLTTWRFADTGRLTRQRQLRRCTGSGCSANVTPVVLVSLESKLEHTRKQLDPD